MILQRIAVANVKRNSLSIVKKNSNIIYKEGKETQGKKKTKMNEGK
jgi:hypothetical protein